MTRFRFFILLGFSTTTFFAQQIYVKYLHVRSPIVSINEHLYINKDGNVLSVQDSLVQNERFSNNLNPMRGRNLKAEARTHISDISAANARDFLYVDNIDTETYFVYDKNVPKPKWTIDRKSTKKIAGYTCTRAEAIFRGSPVIAYFAEDIPVSAGPYKFYGLPGLILEIRVKGKSYDMWKAESVKVGDHSLVNFKPSLDHLPKITMRELVALRDEKAANFMKKMQKDLPAGTVVSPGVANNRYGIETKYEWE